jgi:predicted nucleic acid-binding protein
LAEEKGKPLLSNDYSLIKVARARGVECWWLTTFVLNAYAKGTVKKKEAKQILLDLLESGLRISPRVYASILSRIEEM